MLTLRTIAELGISAEHCDKDIYETAEFEVIGAKMHTASQALTEALSQAVSEKRGFELLAAMNEACELERFEVERTFYKIGYADAMRLLLQGLLWEPGRSARDLKAVKI